MKLAILGTGLVALKLNEYLKNDGYLADIYSSRKNKKFLDYKELENNEYDVVFGCLDGEKTKEIYPKVKAKIFIDNSECFRLNKNYPLYIAGVNENIINKETKLVANPNCVAIMLASFLMPFSKAFKIKKVIVNSLQAVSGMGQKAKDYFLMERSDFEYFDQDVTPRFSLNGELIQILDNVIPLVGEIEKDGISHEERKISEELEKLIPNIEVATMCYRIPVLNGHTASLHITLDENFDKNKVLRFIETKLNIKYIEICSLKESLKNSEDIYATRLKKDPYCPYGFFITLMSNNITIGAAYNSYRAFKKYEESNKIL